MTGSPAAAVRGPAGGVPVATRATLLIAGGGTGGHLMPGLAIAAALLRRHPAWRIVMVGARRGVEARLLPDRGLPFELLPFEPLYRRQWWRNVRWPVLAVRLVRGVGRLLVRERPDLVLGTGGYASGPVVWLAARRGVPTAILEQDAYPGLATRLLARRVRAVFLGAPEAARELRPGRDTTVAVTGSPIAPPEPERRAAARERFGLTGTDPVLLVTGGSQGSLALNELVAQWLVRGGAAGVLVLWSTGRGTLERFRPYHRPPAVQVFEFIDPMADAYAVADLVLCRAGMMTLAEVAAWGLPSVLLPLPSAAQDHQRRNARAAADAGAAVVLEQDGLTPEMLGETIVGLLRDPARRATLAARARERGRPDAVADIAERIERLVRA
jgi:UDP-N-acetylglucosamine--N-acetylmuramyl-(pentapeptide) pyrophosphoryl-undecaprenol N-acetylglucosamine transferase